MSEITFMGVPRAKIDWCPRIDYDKCNDCMECVEFCPHDVFEVREDGTPKLIVKNPENCVVFCRACSKACWADAIDFPIKTETTAHIKKIRALADEPSTDESNSKAAAESGDFYPKELCYQTYSKDKFIFRIPDDKGFFFNENDVWAYVAGNKARIGVTDFVQKSLSDILFFSPLSIGSEIGQFEEAGNIESAKAVFEIVSPVSGIITAVNEKLEDAPELLNENPYEQGWILEMELSDFESDKDLLHEFEGYFPVLKRKVDEFRV